MTAELTMVRPSLTLDVPLEDSLRLASKVARLGGFCENSKEEGKPSRIVFYDTPSAQSEVLSPRVSNDFREGVLRALGELGLAEEAERLRVGHVRMGEGGDERTQRHG